MKPHSRDFFSCVVFAGLLLACASFADSQTVAPFAGLGNAQFFDNNGAPLTAGVLYSYQAGTTTQQATFTDASGATLNPNPLPFGSGGRVNIWLTAGNFYKFVLCLQNDGPFCAPADVLFTVDNVPGSPASINTGTTYTATFISNSPNPASSGILRLASSDQICWRNSAGTANLCILKDPNDVLEWTGGTIKFPEVTCSNNGLNFDYLCADSITHHWKFSGNGGAQLIVPGISAAGTANHMLNLAANGIDIQDSGELITLSSPVTFSATPTFAAQAQDQLFTITLSGNVTSSTLTTTGLVPPSYITFEITQDGTGGRTFVWPGNVQGPVTMNRAPNSVTLLHFLWDGTNAVPVNPGCNIVSKIANYTLAATDCVIHASVSSGAFTLTIPHLSAGSIWEITRTDATANALTIAADSGTVNGAASFHLGANSTTVCHADGINAWCSIPGTEYVQSTTLSGSALTFTYPVPYSATPNCFCTGYGGSCNVASVSTTACVLSAVTVANNAVLVSGKP